MWNWFNCYLSGRHEFGPWCEPGAIFLRCVHCGRRSAGWAMDAKSHPHPTAPVLAATKKAPATLTVATAPRRVLPFGRIAAR
jgi:hypothetical protein